MFIDYLYKNYKNVKYIYLVLSLIVYVFCVLLVLYFMDMLVFLGLYLNGVYFG